MKGCMAELTSCEELLVQSDIPVRLLVFMWNSLNTSTIGARHELGLPSTLA